MKLTSAPAGTAAVAALGGAQWLLFMFTNTVVIPLSIGQALHLAPAVITASLARSFMLTGLACLAQALVGHGLPLMEGQAGIWWGVLLSVAASAPGAGLTRAEIGGSLATGILIASVLTILLGALGLAGRLRALFTPAVMSVFYFLLGAQLAQLFFKGMVGLSGASSQIQPGVALLSLAVVALVLALSILGRGLVSNFALLIGIVVGWPLYLLLVPAGAPSPTPAGSALFGVLPWGGLAANPGILITIILTGFLSATNTFGALEGTRAILGTPISTGQYRRSFIVTGIVGLAAGALGTVPYAPYVSSLGFLRATRITARLPFLLGGAAFILLGAVPALGQLFASLPVSVGDAVLFVAYAQLFGSALANLDGLTFTFQTIYRVAVPVFVGVALMTIPAAAFGAIPIVARVLVQNGLIMGILAAILLDRLVRWDRLPGATGPSAVPASEPPPN